MNAELQEWFALSLVIAVVGFGIYRAFLKHGARPLSIWLLKQGRVKWAMRLRRLGR